MNKYITTIVIHLGYHRGGVTDVIDGVCIGRMCEKRRMLHEVASRDIIRGEVVGGEAVQGVFVGGSYWQKCP